MNCFSIELKEEKKDLESLLSFEEEGKKNNDLFRKVKEKFADSLVDGDSQDQPFLYMKIVAIREPGEDYIASYMSRACFKIEVREDLIEFIHSER